MVPLAVEKGNGVRCQVVWKERGEGRWVRRDWVGGKVMKWSTHVMEV